MTTVTQKKRRYRAFGFDLYSDIEFPELPQGEEGANLLDNEGIIIQFADLSDEWAEFIDAGRNSDTVSDRVMFRIEGSAMFDIRDGRIISVDAVATADEDELRLFILGSCMGAILMQRGILPLHGSAVVIGGRAYGIIGESGAGKSTLAAAFIQAGYRLASDDVIALSFGAESMQPTVTPSYPQQKLWRQSLDGFGISSESLRPIFKRETKFAVPLSDGYCSEPIPLAGLFELVKTEKSEPVLEQVSRLERLPLLRIHTYRHFWLDRMGLTDWHFRLTARLAAAVDIYRLQRPLSGFTAPELVDRILHTLKEEGRTDDN